MGSDLVWRHPASGAALWQGDMEAVTRSAEENGVQVLAAVADNMDLTALQAGYRRRGYLKFYAASLRDVGSMIQSELEWTKQHANAVADRLLENLTRGRSALVCCRQGYNRSGLVSALVMTKAGVAPQQAIELLRQKRSLFALNNDLFCRIVRGEA